ncbi:MAG: hypothetical protein QM628_12525 [Propionicimonas sp.]
MSLWDLTRLLARSWVLVLVAATLGAIGASATLLDQSVMYVSTSKILAVNQVRVPTYIQMVQTDAVLRSAAEEVGLTAPIDQLSSQVSATTPTGTAVVVLSVTSNDPQSAQAFASAITTNLIEEIQAFETAAGVTVDPVRVIQPAGPATAAPGNSVTRSVLSGFALGGLVGLGLTGIRYLVGLPIRRENEIESLADAPVIGRLEGQGAGTAPDLDGEHLQQAMQFLSAGGRRIFAVVDAVPDQAPGQPALALTEGLARAGSRVVLVNLACAEPLPNQDDPETLGVSDVLAGRVPVEQVMQQWNDLPMWTIPPGCHAPNPAELLTIPAASELFRGLEQEFDYVITTGAVSLISGTSSLLGGSLLIVTMKDTTDRELLTSVALLRDSAPLVGIITRERTSRGMAAWLSRVRRRWAWARQSQ